MAADAKHIGILLFYDVEELDAIGPWEVLSSWARRFPDEGYAVSCLSKAGWLVRCAKGLVVQAHHSYADAPPLEVLLYAGGNGTRPHLRDDAQSGVGPPPARRRPAHDQRLHRFVGLRGRRTALRSPRHDALFVA
jgi:putative intracellular protease/amidase